MDGWHGRIFRGCGYFDPDKMISAYTKKEMHDLLYREPTKIKVDGINLTYTGLIPQIQKSFLAKDRDAMQPHIGAFVDRAITFQTCPDCEGTRLSDGARSTPAAHKILDRLNDVGLGYLTLGQPLPTLSGGERQRLKLATHMAEKGDVYVLDEPTTGLHLADVEQLLGLLDRLVDSGKSVIVIEHHQAVMAHADWIIDLGPGAGHDGGHVVFEGTPADLLAQSSTLTGQYLKAYVESGC